MIDRINDAQTMHFQRKQFQLSEDPWDNYLFHDSQKLIHLICHRDPLSITDQLLLAKFIDYTVSTETISQYRQQGKDLIS